MSDLSTDTEVFSWPQMPPLDPQTRLPARNKQGKMLTLLMVALYITPLIALASLGEHLVSGPVLKKFVPILIMFFGGLSIVMLFSSLPALVASFYQNRKLKEAELLCRIYLFSVGNFSPFSLETALMHGLLSEVLLAQCRLKEAEKAARDGIVCCLGNEQYSTVPPTSAEAEKYKTMIESYDNLSMPTKGMLYETFGTVLRNQKNYDRAIEAGKISVKLIEEKLHKFDFDSTSKPKDSNSSLRKKQFALAHASTLYELGLTYLCTNNLEQSMLLFKKSLKIRLEYTNSPHYTANIYSAIARAYLADGEKEKAISAAKEALELLKQIKLPVEELAKARALSVLSEAEQQLGKIESGKKLAIESKEIRQKWLFPGDPELT